MKQFSFPQFIFGYHGCDRKLGEAVLAGKKTLVPSQNGYDWLGAGIYFWENAPERALEWAKNCVSNPKRSKGQIKEPFVLGAIIDLGLCLNLTDVGQMEILRTAYDSVKESFERDGIKLPKNTEQCRELDYLVINMAVELSKQLQYGDFDTVRGAFIEGAPIYPGAKISALTHIQVCVRNIDCIRGFFLPAGI